MKVKARLLTKGLRWGRGVGYITLNSIPKKARFYVPRPRGDGRWNVEYIGHPPTGGLEPVWLRPTRAEKRVFIELNRIEEQLRRETRSGKIKTMTGLQNRALRLMSRVDLSPVSKLSAQEARAILLREITKRGVKK